MCGIFGFTTSQPQSCPPIDMGRALEALHHRGPDDRGAFSDDANGVHCELGHTRLSIVDLSPAGHQPMETSDGRYVITFNGEVFNFGEIRRELEERGARFRSQTDTEVILQSFAHWGRNCLSRFRGMFAFAIFDRREGTLFVARDRLGIKPLYYASVPGGIVFSSEVRALMAAGAVRRRLALDGVRGYLAFGSVPEPHTILADVRALPAGCWLEQNATGRVIEPYWRIPIDDASVCSRRDYDEEVHALREVLRDSIRLRLIADVPIGVFLSGGIDSSAIVSLAAEISNAPLHTFAITLGESCLSEGRYAEAAARRFGCVHRSVSLSPVRAREEIDEALAALDQPSCDGVNTYFISQAVRQAGITVALSGLGGDEVFGGYPFFRYLQPLLRVLQSLPSAVGRVSGAASDLFSEWLPNRARKAAALASAQPTVAEAYGVVRALFTPQQRRALLGPLARDERFSDYIEANREIDRAFREGGSDAINMYSALELSNYMRNTLLRDSDSMSMAHALEIRVPLLDHHVVEHVARIPGNRKLRRGVNKPLLVGAVPTLPRAATNRRKMGFTLPFDAWLRGPLQGWAEQCLLGDGVKRPEILQREAVARKWREYMRGEQSLSWSRVWALITLQKWCERHDVQL